MDVGEQNSVGSRDSIVIRFDGKNLEKPIDEGLPSRPPGLIGQFHSGKQLCKGDGGDDQVVVGLDGTGRQCSSFHRDEHPGIDDQSAGHAGASGRADSRAARTSVSKRYVEVGEE
jgi:hypothetical protein